MLWFHRNRNRSIWWLIFKFWLSSRFQRRKRGGHRQKHFCWLQRQIQKLTVLYRLSDGIVEFTDHAIFALVGSDALIFLDKAAALHDLHGSLVIRKADTGDFRKPQLGHDDRQECFDCFGGVTFLGVVCADVVAHLPGAVVKGNSLDIADVGAICILLLGISVPCGLGSAKQRNRPITVWISLS